MDGWVGRQLKGARQASANSGEGYRVNGSIDRSISVVNDKRVDILDDITLSECMTLATNGTQPPDEWLFVRGTLSVVNAHQYRRAVIDAGTAAELALTAPIDRQIHTYGNKPD